MTSPAVLVIASGDGDFIPLVDVAHEAGWTVEMAAFKSAFSPMGAMAMKVDRIRALDDALDRIGDTTTEDLDQGGGRLKRGASPTP